MNKARFQCPECHQEFAARAGVVGKTVRCLACGAHFLAGNVQVPRPPPPPAPPQWEERLPLLIFATVFLGGLFACYWGIWEPLKEMQRRETEVKYSTVGLSSGPLLLLLSLVLPFWIASDRKDVADGYLPAGDISRMGRLLLMVVVFGVIFGMHQWFEQKATSLGYRKGSLLPPPVALPAPSPVNISHHDVRSWRPKTGVPEEILRDYQKKLREIERELNKVTSPTKPLPSGDTHPTGSGRRE